MTAASTTATGRNRNPMGGNDRSPQEAPRRVPPGPQATGTLPYMSAPEARGPVARELSRRDFMRHATVLGAGALVLSALPIAERMIEADPALALVTPDDATLQAFADTILPGRKADKTDLGNEIHPQAIAGVDTTPGAVEADTLALMKDPRIGFEALAAPFLADVEGRALSQGGPFLSLPFDKRVAVVLSGLDYGNGSRTLWE